MRGEVINTFRDKFHYDTIYEVGAVVDFEKERMKDLVARGLCKLVDKPIRKPLEKNKVEKKEVLVDTEPEKKEETKKEVLTGPNDEELDEKAKSEREAAEKIAKATAKAKKN